MRRKNLFSEVPKKGSVSSEYFFRMMSPRASKISKRYIDDETELLTSMISGLEDHHDYNLVVVAGGQLGKLQVGLELTKSYTCIEPLTDLYMGRNVLYLVKKMSKIRLVKKLLSEVRKGDLPEGKNIFVFLFNILAYIDNPIKEINRISKPGDVLFISTWNLTPVAKKIRTKYFNYLNSFEKQVIIDPEQTVGICNLEKFPFSQLKYPESHRYGKTEVVEILEVYLK